MSLHYAVDTDYNARLPIHLDVTVAMPCAVIGADFLDKHNRAILVESSEDSTSGFLEEDVVYELEGSERAQWQSKRRMNQHLRENYHSTFKLVWESAYLSAVLPAYRRPDHQRAKQVDAIALLKQGRMTDGCRLFGSVVVSKMAGNFHVILGKALHAGGFHAHVSLFVGAAHTNFSHRIDRLAFGDYHRGLLNPLDGVEKLAYAPGAGYRYEVQIVCLF